MNCLVPSVHHIFIAVLPKVIFSSRLNNLFLLTYKTPTRTFNSSFFFLIKCKTIRFFLNQPQSLFGSTFSPLSQFQYKGKTLWTRLFLLTNMTLVSISQPDFCLSISNLKIKEGEQHNSVLGLEPESPALLLFSKG